MKKFLIAALAVVCFVCIGLSVACNKGPKYYTLRCDARGGLVFNFLSDSEGDETVRSGAEVKEGYNVRFTLGLENGASDDATLDGATVKANDDLLERGEDGVYSFTMTSDTDLTANLDKYLVEFDRYIVSGNNVIDTYTQFTSPDGDTEAGIYVNPNTQISFTVKRSVYYVGDYEITANNMVVVPDEQGVYRLTVTENTTVNVKGLKMDTPFYAREDGGNGTAANPFKISRPIDLFGMSDIIADTFYSESRFYAAYYELTQDIDLEGEQLFVIGDATTDVSFFGGVFNGNGHTISNYYISDTVYDETVVEEDGAYAKKFLPYIGLFGYAQATVYGSAEIYNLNVENFTIDVNAARYGTGCYAGGILGYGMGVNITGCSVNGAEIFVTADENYFAYAGGIAGSIKSAYQSETVRYYSSVRSCSSSANVIGLAGCVYGAGGLVGYLCTYDDTYTAPAYLFERTPAFIINSYSTGDVYGALNAGGIVGRLSPLSSVSGCYSTGLVYADCRIPYEAGYELYAYAYAGGIAGYAGFGSVITDSFSAGAVSAVSVNGANWQKVGGVAGFLQAGGSSYVETNDAACLNSYSVTDNPDITFNNSFITDTLGWNAADWTFGAGYPTVNHAADGKAFKVTVNFADDSVTVGGKDKLEIAISDAYIPMSYWNLRVNGIPEFIDSDSGLRSFGYYFDEALTKKVPFSYVPVNDVTLYVGFADYSEVAGVYYLKTSKDGSNAYIELGADGTLFFRNGALSLTSFYLYAYDGQKITLYDNLVAELFSAYPQYELEYYATLLAELDGDTLSIYGTVYNLVPIYDKDQNVISYSKLAENIAASAVKKLDGFAYGKYYAGSAEYVFNTDGTGLNSAGERFTYTVTANGSDFNLVLSLNGASVNAVISNGKLTVAGNGYTALDIFAGTWEREAACYGQYVFDGKGGWSREYYDFVGGTITLKKESGSYTVVNGNTLNLGNGKTVGFDNGFVIVDGETYYKKSSYAGKWIYNSSEPVEITFYGIGADGVGTATVDFGASYEEYEANYALAYDASGNEYVEVYYSDVLLGRLSFNEENVLAGSFYSAVFKEMQNDAVFCLYDVFSGEWVCDDGVISSVEFNGLGGYDFKKPNTLPVKGTVKICGDVAGNYTLADSLLSGTFVYNDATYNFSYNFSAGTVSVTRGQDSLVLQKRDEWYGLKLIDGDGTVYSFDGRGNLSNGGALIVTPASGEGYITTYKVNGNGIAMTGSKSGSIAVREKDYLLTLGGETKSLTIYKEFIGDWIIGGEYGQRIVIGAINRLGESQGTFMGEAVQFKYDFKDDYLEFDWRDLHLYVNLLGTGDEAELAVGLDKRADGYYSVCVRVGREDKYAGDKFISSNGSMRFDGLGESGFGHGIVEVTLDEKVTEYYYETDGFGHTVLKTDLEYSPVYVLVLCTAQTENAFGRDGVYMLMVKPDKLYNKTAYSAAASGTVDYDSEYVFDGVGNVTCPLGNCTYVIESIDTTKYIYTFIFTDSEGVKYKVELGYGTGELIINSVNEQ